MIFLFSLFFIFFYFENKEQKRKQRQEWLFNCDKRLRNLISQYDDECYNLAEKISNQKYFVYTTPHTMFYDEVKKLENDYISNLSLKYYGDSNAEIDFPQYLIDEYVESIKAITHIYLRLLFIYVK